MAFKDVGSGGIEWEEVGGERWYLVNLAEEPEDAEEGQYGPNMLWKFWVYDESGETLLSVDDEGESEPWWQWSGTAMGKRATARKWIEALLGRELEKGDSGAAAAAEAVGNFMFAFIAPNDNGRWKIDRVKPYAEPPAKAAPAPAKAPAAKAAPAGKAPAAGKPKPPVKASAAGAVDQSGGDIDPDDLPF